jgi:hypothetical protein
MGRIRRGAREFVSLLRGLLRRGGPRSGAPSHEERVKREKGLERGLKTLDLLELCPDFEEEVNPYSFLYGTSPVIDIALLKALARRSKPCHYLEIGSWRGESLANVASVADQCVSVSLSAQDLKDRGYPDRCAQILLCYAQSLPNVRFIAHDSRTFDFASLEQAFDLVFIDGDHSYRGVLADTRNAFGLLRDQNSMIVWHDCMEMYEKPRWDVIAAIVDGTPPDKRNSLFHVSNTLCIVYLPQGGTLEPRYCSYPAVPNKCFKVTISGKCWSIDQGTRPQSGGETVNG